MTERPNEGDAPLGRQHALARRIRALRRSPARRRSEGLAIAEGSHLAREALRSGLAIEQVVYTPRLIEKGDGRDLLAALGSGGSSCHPTTEAVLASLQDARSPQPILCLVRIDPPCGKRGAEVIAGGGLVLLLEGLQDPGNLGSIVRSAEAAGVELLIVGGEHVDPTHPRALRASAGSLFRLRPFNDGLTGWVDRLRRNEYTVLGADPQAAVAYDRFDLRQRVALLLGGESCGISPTLRSCVDVAVRIPMHGGVESLSVSAAAAALLFEVRRQRSAG